MMIIARDGEHYGEHPTVGGDDFCSYGVRKS